MTKHPKLPCTRFSNSFAIAVRVLLGLMTLQFAASAADVTWDGGAAGNGTAWLTGANWDNESVPDASDNAVFGAAGTVTICTINMGTVGGLQQVGSITMGSGRIGNLSIRNLTSSTANGVLQLNGSNGILLSNEVSLTLTITNGASGSTSRLGLGLAASGDIYVVQNGQITIGSDLSEIGGSHGFTKRGEGILYIRNSSSTLSGAITNAEGAIKVDDSGVIGDGPVYLAGGNIIIGLDRSGGPPLANSFVMLGDAIIYNDGGLTGTFRTIPFSGPFSGDVGTLTIANLTGVGNNTFITRWSGAFTFNRPIVIGPGFETPGSFSVLQLYNSLTNGTLTLSGDISGQGSIRRQGATSSPGGVAILTGDNTYFGGTLVTYGTLLANNSVGSALGSGAVVVTNQGVLGGNGTILAPTTVSLGGTIAPGSAATNVGNLKISDFTADEGGVYQFQISGATGTAGTAWDVITAGGGSGMWIDAATAVNPFTIKLDSMGVAPSGWNSTVARDWVIIDGGAAAGFDSSHFALDTSSFAAPIAGVFSLSVVSGDLHLIYTPAPDVVLNVPSGSQTQAGLGYPTLSGTVGVVKIGDGEAVINNPANDYAGITRIHAGTMTVSVDALNGSGAFGSATTAVLLGNTTGNSNATLNIDTDGVTMGRNLVVQSGSTGVKTIGTTLTSGAALFTGDITLQDDVTLTAPSGGAAAFSGLVSGDGGITKVNAGTVYLTNGNNTFNGKTKILGGTLSIDAVGRLGSLPLAQVDDQITIDGATLEFTASTASSAPNRGFKIGDNGATFNVTGGQLTLNGPVSGTGDLIKLGPNRMDLNHGTNSYAGDTYINEGEIAVDDDGMLGAGTIRLNGGGLAISANRSTTPSKFITNAIAVTNNALIRTTGGTAGTQRIAVFTTDSITTTGGSLVLSNGASASTNTFDLRLLGAGFTVSCPVVLDAGIGESSIMQLFLGSSNGTAPQTFSGVISGTGRVRRSAMVSSDAGTSILTAANTYSGGTAVAAGTLLVNNTTGSGTGSGAVTLSGVGILGGTGTIAGPVSGGGNIAPGNSVGTLTLQGGLDLSANGTYIWELGANSTSNPGVNYDVLAVNGGNVVLGGTSKLALAFTGSATAPDASDTFWQSPHSWTILTVSGGASNPGLTAFATITNSYVAGTFTNYADAGGNIVLAFTPSAVTLPPQINVPAKLNDGNFRLTFSGVSGQGYTVRAGTNVDQARSTWTVLSTGTFDGSPVIYDDLNATNFLRRFYSVSIP